jgi:hypothetical protein
MHHVIERMGDASVVGHDDDLFGREPRVLEHLVLPARGGIPEPLSRPAMRAEPALAKLVDRCLRHRWVWPTLRLLVRWGGMPQIDLDDRPGRVEHVPNRVRDPGSIHPMEGLSEADDPERTEGCWKLLGPHPHPRGVVDLFLERRAFGFGHHGGVRVHADHAVEEAGEQQGDTSRTAADVEQSALAVQAEVRGQGVGETGGVGLASLAVVRSRALEDRVVPGPVLPAVWGGTPGHLISVSETNSHETGQRP